MIKFTIEEGAPVPVAVQIQEEIRLALSLGTLRTGDVLPSIRDVAAQTGVNRGKIHQAYRSLEQLGLVRPHRGRNIVAAEGFSSDGQITLHDKCEQLSRTVIERARLLGVPPTALARYLVRQAYAAERTEPLIAFVGHKAFAQEVAPQISRMWSTRVVGLTREELQAALQNRSSIRKVLAHRLRFDQVRSLVRGRNIEVIPIGTRLSDETVRQYKRLAPDAAVVLFLHQQEYQSHRFIVEQSRQWIRSRDVSAALWRGAKHFLRFLKDKRYDYLSVDQHIWSELPAEVQRNPKVVLGRIQLDLPSVEAARIRAGVIL